MRQLTDNSTNVITYQPTTDLDSLTLSASVEGVSVDLGQPVKGTGDPAPWTLTVQSADVPDPWSDVELVWTLTAGSQVLTDTEHADVVPYVPDPAPPVLLSTMRDVLRIDDGHDDERLWALLTEAAHALSLISTPTWPRVTEQRTEFVDGTSVWAHGLVTASSVTDTQGNALTFIEVPGREFVSRLILHTPYTGDVLIDGTWGSAEPSATYQRAVIACVKAWYRREATGDDRDAFGNLRAIPAEAHELMEAERPVRI